MSQIEVSKTVAIAEHVAHISNVTCIHMSQIEASKTAAIAEHGTHIGNVACI